ncbi:SGNH/GDSL hydrolase family protein [Streptomyces sp. SID3343]|uniref:SGNH/GDSL hydrolase family protein n=1 Tax=Streptomyces sp. SID3343 TaxID=2690260 RepID=UPI00136C8ED5|nr:SGNH/GDSL hydrolase family protein [Streptomyces sp. SID3343]MYV99425.1 SGNH/GDSL hydrolase family protein [Streptomyces sp. SID3343]
MNSQTNPATRRRRTVRLTAGIALATATGVFGLTACDDSDHKSQATGGRTDTASSAGASAEAGARQGPSGAGNKSAKLAKLLWMGDSIGAVEAPALEAAMKADGVEFASMAAAGGGGVIGEPAEPTWEQLPKELGSFKPNVVVYQITTYDWGNPQEQQAGYERLVKTVTDAGAELVIVSAPPFKIDDFYQPHEAEIKSAPKSARDVADKHPDKVRFLDAAALWGTDSTAAKAQRSNDGIHSCQQGAAAFAHWLGKELGKQYSFTPAAVDRWATGSWTGDKVYARLGCK